MPPLPVGCEKGDSVAVQIAPQCGIHIAHAPDVTDAPDIAGRPPQLIPGTELVGPYQGSGYREARFLVVRGDGQVIQLPELLYRIAGTLDGRRSFADVATEVSAQGGRTISAEQVADLVRTRLQPAGIVGGDGGDGVAAARSDPLLMLRLRLPVVPARAVWRVAAVFGPLFHPAAVVLALLAVLALDVAVLATGGLGAVAPAAVGIVERPVLALLVIAALVGAGALHECGHVGACRYGGARPGPMGVGVYLVWPAFYSTVTDSYRLSRAGRLRTDLGGVYLNAIVIGLLAAGYLWTGALWALIALALLHVETVRQFLPSVRLDGYYILSDVIGLPDLFMFLRPVLRSVRPWRAPDPRVAALRPWVRATIVAWVLIVVPFLLTFLVFFALLLPQVLPQIAEAVQARLATAATGVRAGDGALVALSVVQVALLVLPVVGGVFLLGTWSARGLRAVRTVGSRRRPGMRPWHVLLAVAALLGLLTAFALAGLRGSTAGPLPADGPGARQVAAGAVLLGTDGPSAAPTVLLLAGVAAALLTWPVARRLGQPPPVAGLAVLLAGAPALLTGAFGLGGLAALWLVAAAGLVGRGPGANGGALALAALAVATTPIAAVGLLAFAAHGCVAGQLARTWRVPARRVLAAVLGAAAVAAAVTLVPTPGLGGAPPAVLVAGALVAAAALFWLRRQRPIATGAAALLGCAAVAGPDAVSALLVALPAVALLAAFGVRRIVRRRSGRAAGVLAAAALATLLAGMPLAATAAANPAVAGTEGPVMGNPARPQR